MGPRSSDADNSESAAALSAVVSHCFRLDFAGNSVSAGLRQVMVREICGGTNVTAANIASLQWIKELYASF